MRVFLMRHGEASDRAPDGSFNDDARELTPRGTERLEEACATYARVIGTPRLLLHSPLTRARQSATILTRAMGSEFEIRITDELRPSGRASRVIDLLQGELLGDPGDIVCVGHEPLLGDLLGLLSTGSERVGMPMGIGMLAAVTFTTPQVMIGRLTTLLNQDTATRLSSTE